MNLQERSLKYSSVTITLEQKEAVFLPQGNRVCKLKFSKHQQARRKVNGYNPARHHKASLPGRP